MVVICRICKKNLTENWICDQCLNGVIARIEECENCGDGFDKDSLVNGLCHICRGE